MPMRRLEDIQGIDFIKVSIAFAANAYAAAHVDVVGGGLSLNSLCG